MLVMGKPGSKHGNGVGVNRADLTEVSWRAHQPFLPNSCNADLASPGKNMNPNSWRRRDFCFLWDRPVRRDLARIDAAYGPGPVRLFGGLSSGPGHKQVRRNVQHAYGSDLCLRPRKKRLGEFDTITSLPLPPQVCLNIRHLRCTTHMLERRRQ